MPVIALTQDNFQATIENNQIVIVDFWASWCAPCMAFAEVFEKIASSHPDIVFAKVNTEEQGELAASFNIRSIPHLMVFKAGILIYSNAGSMPESAFSDLVSQAIDADITAIQAEIDKANQAESDD